MYINLHLNVRLANKLQIIISMKKVKGNKYIFFSLLLFLINIKKKFMYTYYILNIEQSRRKRKLLLIFERPDGPSAV